MTVAQDCFVQIQPRAPSRNRRKCKAEASNEEKMTYNQWHVKVDCHLVQGRASELSKDAILTQGLLICILAVRHFLGLNFELNLQTDSDSASPGRVVRWRG